RRLQKSLDRGIRPADARTASLVPEIRLTRGDAVHGQRQAPWRRERFRAFVNKAFGDELVGHHAAQIIGRLCLHAPVEFFGEQFEEKCGHQTALPASVWTHASPQAFASSRTRMM